MKSRPTVKSMKGFTLVETVMAVALFSFLILMMAMALHAAFLTALKSRQQVQAARLAQTIHSRLVNMNFHDIFSCDSSDQTPDNDGRHPMNHLLNWNQSPAQASLRDIEQQVRRAGFTRFSIDVRYMRRDSSDSNLSGSVVDMIAFRDQNSDLADDFDPAVRFMDHNNDDDYFDADGVLVDAPDTHLKQVDISLWIGSHRVLKHNDLISAEHLTGALAPSTESPLKLLLQRPPHGAVFYQKTTPEQTAAQNLPLAKNYPPGWSNVAFQVDASSPLALRGLAEPLSEVRFWHGSPAGPAHFTTADSTGSFQTAAPPAFTGLFTTEGEVSLWARVTKGALSSPYHQRLFIVDTQPPVFENRLPAPNAVVRTLSPVVACTLADYAADDDATPSGPYAGVMSLFVEGSSVPYQATSTTNAITMTWKTEDTLLPPKLENGRIYHLTAEGGDRARYKRRTQWQFEVAIADPDDTPAAVACAGVPGGVQCVLNDPDSGVDASSLVLRVDGIERVSRTVTPAIGQFFDAATGAVTYVPTPPLSPGIHRVSVEVDHWADNPPAAKRAQTGDIEVLVP